MADSERPPAKSSLTELRELGLTVEIGLPAADRAWAQLLIISGRLLQGSYRKPAGFGWSDEHLFDAYHAIAKEVVKPNTSDEVLEDVIPATVLAFQQRMQWRGSGSIEIMKRVLRGPIEEWKGRRLLIPQPPEPVATHPQPNPGGPGRSAKEMITRLMYGEVAEGVLRAKNEIAYEQELKRLREKAASTKDSGRVTSNGPPSQTGQTTAQQIEQLRQQCRLTVEDLAEELAVDPRSVFRHLSGESIPRSRHIAAYERVFSDRLKTKVVINQTSGKRQ